MDWIQRRDRGQFSNSVSGSSSGPSSKASPRSAGSSSAPTSNPQSFERIRQLEAELADLRARRDITSLTREEFEILATETAMTLIKTAQTREARAVAAAEQTLGEAQQAAKQLTETTENKARTLLQNAEGRGRKYLETAEREAKEAIASATKSAQELLDAKNREASSITLTARREAERVIAGATGDIANFRSWLNDAISESERLQKIHNQALTAAEEAIRQTRTKITSAFERLSALSNDIEGALDDQNRPKEHKKENEYVDAAQQTAAKSRREINNCEEFSQIANESGNYHS
ncbi:MAG: hypothetical protein WDN07_05545 [Actinomycetota bacterium]